jgi:hypothetical protein
MERCLAGFPAAPRPPLRPTETLNLMARPASVSIFVTCEQTLLLNAQLARRPALRANRPSPLPSAHPTLCWMNVSSLACELLASPALHRPWLSSSPDDSIGPRTAVCVCVAVEVKRT